VSSGIKLFNSISNIYGVFFNFQVAYYGKRGLLTTIIEWLERGDYFNFIKVAKDELDSVFLDVEVIDVDTRAAWYICKKPL